MEVLRLCVALLLILKGLKRGFSIKGTQGSYCYRSMTPMNQTRSSKAINALGHESNESCSEQSDDSVKSSLKNEPIIGDDREPIPDAVNTLNFTIASHFIGDPSLWKDRSAKRLSNLRCKTLSDFRWYKDTFLTRVYTREDSPQPFWKEKFLAELPKSLGDKVRDKIRSLTPDGIIPYDELSYGQLISFIQKVVLMICSDNDSGPESSDDNINNIQVDDIESSSDSDVKQINVLSKDQDLLFDVIEAIDNPEQKKDFLLKLKGSLQKEKKPKNLVLSNKFDVKSIFKKLEKQVIRPITIQDLQSEVNNLKREIQEIKINQDNHQLILSQIIQQEESEDEELDHLLDQTMCSKRQQNEIPNDNDGKEILRIINVFSFMKHRVHIRIVVKDFVLETIALFDSGAYSNCIKEGLIPTKYFEKSTESLSSITGERLNTKLKLTDAFVEKGNLKIPTNFIIAMDIKNDVVLGTTFIILLFPYLADSSGLTSFVGGQ
ncbi:hypothetical protein HN873_015840, partial [Arachis hypogaea]